MSIPGFDVSHWQGSVNFQAAKDSGQEFVFLKATEGSSTTDSMYKTNVAAARAAGLPVGAYHFYRTAYDPEVQANHFLQFASPQIGDLPSVLDIEENDGKTAKDIGPAILKFLSLVESYIRRPPIVYCTKSFCDSYIQVDLSHYVLWVANYNVSAPKIPSCWRNWSFWQKSQTGKVTGVNGNADVNDFAGTVSDLQDLLIK